MKRIKKFASLLLAMVMVMTMALPAFAADNKEHDITITLNPNDTATHRYAAYQIFKGDLVKAEEVNGDVANNGQNSGQEYVLSNIEWGNSINATNDEIINALKADTTIVKVNDKNLELDSSETETTFGSFFTNCKTAADVANELAKFTSQDRNSSGAIDTFATIISGFIAKDNEASTWYSDEVTASATVTNTTIKVPSSGYYMVMDTNITGTETDSAYTRYMLQVVGDVTMNVKSEVPGGDKKVYSAVPDASTNNGVSYKPGEANYATIGDHVSYEITSKVPNYNGYSYYYFIMNDKLSDGLTFDGAATVAVKIKKADGSVVDLERDTDYYVYTEDVGDYSFRLTFDNIMDSRWAIGDEVIVTYSATVNNKAVIGNMGNSNTWSLNYSNNPNSTHDGNGRPDGRPGLPFDESSTPLGKTPDEYTLTYLTQVDITKFANEAIEANLLAGAEFTLTGTSYQVVLNEVEYYEVYDGSKNGIDNNIYYKLLPNKEEPAKELYTTTVPTGTDYVAIGVGDADTTKGYILVDGEYVIPSEENGHTYDGQTLYKKVQGTASEYADVNTTYIKLKKTTTDLVPVDVSIELTTDDTGKISFIGLGEGTYTLKETVTPAGYNTLEDIEFKITFEGPKDADGNSKVDTVNDQAKWKIEVTKGGEVVKFNVDENGFSSTGIFATDVINNSGSLLPSTGGIGTTIFYVVGGILIIGAGILLVTKKRMNSR